MTRRRKTRTVARMSRRSLPVLAALALVAACGDDPDGASGLPVLRIGAGAGGAESASTSADMAMPGGKSMYAPVAWEFEVAGDLPALDSEMAAYVFRGGAEPSSSQLAALADALGVEGTFTRTTTDPGTDYEWTTWSVGPTDGTGPSITVADDGMLSWWFNEGWSTTSVGREPCEVPIAEDGMPVDDIGCVDEWTPPTPPENVPTANEAESKFRELFTRLGVGADQLTIESYADEWSAGAWGYVSIDGVRSSMTVTASFGENGRLTYAGGYLARPEVLATYPRVGTTVGLERLRDDYVTMLQRVAIEPAVVGAPVLVDPVPADDVTEPAVDVSPDETTADEGAPDQTTTDDSAPDDTIPEPTIPVDVMPDEVIPETVVVTIDSVEEEYVTYWSVDGDVYLVPGYTFVAAPDEWGYRGRYTVPAIPSEYLEMVEPPMSVEPMPIEPMPVEPGDGGGSSGSSDGAIAISDDDLDSFLGLSEDDAIALAEERGWKVRVASRDGEFFSLTMDYLVDRVNLTIVGDTVTEVTIG